jgi:hypothetical protein
VAAISREDSVHRMPVNGLPADEQVRFTRGIADSEDFGELLELKAFACAYAHFSSTLLRFVMRHLRLPTSETRRCRASAERRLFRPLRITGIRRWTFCFLSSLTSGILFIIGRVQL